MKYIAIFLLFFYSFNGFTQQPTLVYPEDQGRHPAERFVDFTHLLLDVAFVPEAGKVNGMVTHTFDVIRPKVDSLFLHGPGIVIEKAEMKGNTVTWETFDDGIVFRFARPLEYNKSYQLSLTYEAFPKKGLYFVGWNDATGRSRKQIWSQGQGTDNRHWIPMYDLLNDKVVSEMKVSFPSDYYVLSNGQLQSRSVQKGGNVQWHYKMPAAHSTYLIMLGIGNYKVKELRSTSGVPLQLLYYPDHEDRVETAYKYSKEMMDWFEKETGVPYPWLTYSQIPVQDFMYGAMENTSATLFGDFFMVDARGYNDRNYVGVNAHELAHQWFGDLITARAPQHHWLQESFATFYNMMYEREVFGNDYYDWALRQAHLRAFEATRSDYLPVAHSQGGTSRHYPKGASVLHMLRSLAGEEGYRLAIKQYLLRHKFRNVDSHDLLNSFEETLGMSLQWFWDQWILKGGEPEIEVNFEEIQLNNGRYIQFSVSQIQPFNDLTSVFTLPLDVEVVGNAGQSVLRQREWMRSKDMVFKVLVPDTFRMDYFLIDSGRRMLMKQRIQKSPEMLKKQALHAKHVNDIWDAVQGLSSSSWSFREEVFRAVLKRSSIYFSVKEEIARQALALYDSELGARTLFLELLADKDLHAVKAAVQLVARGDYAMAEALVPFFNRPDASYDALAKALFILSDARHPGLENGLALTEKLRGNRGHSFRVTWLEVSIMNQKNTQASIRELVDLCSISYDFLTRVAAYKALSRLNILTFEMLDHAVDTYSHANSRLSGPVKESLRFLVQMHGNKEIVYAWMTNRPEHRAKVKSALGL
jgi:aminopeptidase N